MMSCQCMAAPLKNQTHNILSEAQISEGMCLIQKSCVWLHMVLIYGEHVSPARSVTHTGYGNDQADIPKKGRDPTTSWAMQMKISRYTSHELQGSTRSGDDITESTVLMVIKVIIPAPDKTQVRKTSTRNNVKNINHIHGRTKNQGQVWPSYFSKVS